MLLTSQWPGLNRAIFIFLSVIIQVRAEQCDNGILCSPPKTCCYDSCCQVYNPDTDTPYGPPQYPTYGYYPFGFFNVWYFWLVIICIAMSCCGGCGYWRRRQIYLSTSTTTHIQIQNGHQLAESGESDRASVASGGADNYVHHSEGPRIHANVRLAFPDCLRLPPPPYSEVTSKPEMYPLVQAGFMNLKDLVLPSLYATTPFISSLLEYESGHVCGALAGSVSSPAESNTSSLFRTGTPSNCAFPPPYTEGRTYSRWACAPSTVSTPGSVLDMYTSSECEYGYSPQRCTSLVSPPMATTPTSQSMFSELSSTCSSNPPSPSHSPSSPSYISPSYTASPSPTATEEYESHRHGENLLAAIVADIRDMTQRVNVTSPSTSSTDPSSNTSVMDSNKLPKSSKEISMSSCGNSDAASDVIDEGTRLLSCPGACHSQQ